MHRRYVRELLHQLRHAGKLCILCAVLLLSISSPGSTSETLPDGTWFTGNASGQTIVHLHFFWTRTCPHCQEARPFVESLAADTPWLDLHSYELTGHPEHVSRYIEMAATLGQEARSVPAFLFCGQMRTGYDSHQTTGAALAREIAACRTAMDRPAGGTTLPVHPSTDSVETDLVRLPLLGDVRAATVSLPLLTVLIAGLDAFNPCAFFVLLFLLSLLVHARSRTRMALIGGIFVLCSGLVYFFFMAAWLNVFLWIGELQWVTLVAGCIAVAVALINIKDFFWFQRGVTLSIPKQAKPGLFQRMRDLLGAAALPSIVLGTVVLALVANAYELLCTSGFPMVYTRVLTLNELQTGTYYLYLVLYNLIYVLPLLLIVTVFTWTLGSRKLSEQSGRTLKLLSGTMMLALGAALIIAPERLSSPLFAAMVPLGAIAVALMMLRLRKRQPASSVDAGTDDR